MAYFPTGMSLHDVTKIAITDVRTVENSNIGTYVVTRMEITQKGRCTDDSEIGVILDFYSPIGGTTYVHLPI